MCRQVLNQFKSRAAKKKEILKQQKELVLSPNFDKFQNLDQMSSKLLLENAKDLTIPSISFVDMKKVNPTQEQQDRMHAEDQR